jgi:Ca2+-transporting ATPase
MITGMELLSYDTMYTFLNLTIVCITLVIVAVPEGLPMAVTIAMAFSVMHMKKDCLLMKKMQACETMGTVSEICTGKTATLTTNHMSVKVFYTAG